MAEMRNDKGQFIKGHPPSKPVGSVSRAHKIKEEFLEAFEMTGGQGELVKWIKENKWNRKEFLKMILTLLPKETKLEHGGEGLKIVYGYRNADGSLRDESEDKAPKST